MAQAYEPAALAPLPNMMSIAMSRPQVGIERLPTRRMSNEPRESMNCKSCRKRKVRNCNRGERKMCPARPRASCVRAYWKFSDLVGLSCRLSAIDSAQPARLARFSNVHAYMVRSFPSRSAIGFLDGRRCGGFAAVSLGRSSKYASNGPLGRLTARGD